MPGLLPSTVCLTVIWLLSLCSSHAQIWTNEVSDVQYGRLGSDVMLDCGTSPSGSAVKWHLNHSAALPRHRLTANGTLVLESADQSAQGNFTCHDDRGNLLRSIRLKLGYPPGRLSVSCRVPNHLAVHCTWVDSVETFLPSQYHATIRGRGHSSVERPCVVDPSHRRCSITHPTYWQTAHSLNITETNPLGSLSTTVTIKLHELLKPDPPEAVFVEGQEGFPTKLVVSWSYPSSWPKSSLFPLVFEIRYRPQGSTHWSLLMSKYSPVVITDALVGHQSQVQIRAQDEVDESTQWSDWSPVVLAWPWGALHSTPEPTEEPFLDEVFGNTVTESSNVKPEEEDGNLGLVILLALFSVVILTTVLSLVLMWLKQRRRDHVNKQELASMVKMKSMPI